MRETRPLLPHTPTQASRQWSGLSQPIPFCWGYPPSPGVVGTEEAPSAQDVLPRGQRAVPGCCGNTTKSRKSNNNCYHHPAPRPTQGQAEPPAFAPLNRGGRRTLPHFPVRMLVTLGIRPQIPGLAVLDVRLWLQPGAEGISLCGNARSGNSPHAS